MDEKYDKELSFWKGIHGQMGEGWLEYRARVALDIVSKFPEPYLSEMLSCRDTILEVGTGLIPPMYFWLKDNDFDLVAIDPLVDEYAKIDPTGAKHYIKAGAESIPFKDYEFRHIVCMNVLDHVDDADKAVAEMRRVLMPGGYLFLQTHMNTSIGGPHTYSFNKESLSAIVERHDFEILFSADHIAADGIPAIYIVAQ